MFNILLDDLAADRTRMRELARDVIDAGDRERASIARALQDSTAQHIAALQFELSSAARDAVDPALAVRLRAARDAAEGILEEVRKLSRSVHPAVLDDLGLEAALRRLARDATSGTGVDVDVDSRLAGERLPHVVEVTLYRVASEAITNATRHAAPRRVQVRLRWERPSVVLQVHDDGHGFDPAAVPPAGRGMASMRERLSLVDGALDVRSAKGNGTTVTATVPLEASG
jgi:signal transduction histidine kinase